MPTRSRTALLEIAEQLSHVRKPKTMQHQLAIRLESGVFDLENGKRIED
jgi:hypothetical protein